MISFLAPVARSMHAREVRQIDVSLRRQPIPVDCSACGASGQFQTRVVLPRRLARQWRLSAAQRAAMNIQQGHICDVCGNNLRGRSLADAIVHRLGVDGPLRDAWTRVPPTSVLEINPAAALTPMLSGATRHVRTAFPEVDMQQLPFGDGEFDLVVHSDTLEHVEDPTLAMRECLRVAGEGWVVFTTPVLFDRLTRDRSRRTASYHGGDSGRALVRWEFGADIVALLMSAAANEVSLTHHGYPYACALSCRRTP
jgi:hypothetical protein